MPRYRRHDPTGTLTIRNRAVSEVNARFDRIKGLVRRSIVDNRILANQPATRARFEYLNDPEKFAEFQVWLRGEVQNEIFATERRRLNPIAVTLPPGARVDWLQYYVGTAYAKGVTDTRRAALFMLRGRPRQLTPELILALQRLADETGTLAIVNPRHIERANLLFERVYSQLDGVTKSMEQQMAETLSRSMLNGDNPRDTAVLLNDRVDAIGKVRARLIARTEMINAHQRASVEEADYLSEIVGEDFRMLWMTSIDGRERPSHRARNGNIYTREEVGPLLGEPNCRCSVSAYLDEFALDETT